MTKINKSIVLHKRATDIYLPEEKLPGGIPLPEKKPYLIVNFQNLDRKVINPLFDALQSFGTQRFKGENTTITITGNRNLIQSVNHLMKEINRDVDAVEKNRPLLTKLAQYQNELMMQTKNSSPPPKSKPLANFEEVGTINSESTHSATLVKHKDKDKDKTFVFKHDESNRKINEIEALIGMNYQFLLGSLAPKTRTVHDNEGKRLGVVSEYIKNFSSIADYMDNNKNRPPPLADLSSAGLGKIMAAALIQRENDLHLGNIGYDPSANKTYKIDHGQSHWANTSKYVGLDPNALHPMLPTTPKDTFRWTQRDLNTFPYLTDAKPNNWPTKWIDMQGMETDKKFMGDAYVTFLKEILTPTELYQKRAESALSSPSAVQKFVSGEVENAQLLKNELSKNEKFIQFILNEPDTLKRIISEAEEFNKPLKHDSSLRIDIKQLEDNFNVFKQSCEQTHLLAEPKEKQFYDAVWACDFEKIDQLLSDGKDPNKPFADGTTALYTAILNGKSALVDALIEGGANPHQEVDGYTAMELAEYYQDQGIISTINQHLRGRQSTGPTIAEQQTTAEIKPVPSSADNKPSQNTSALLFKNFMKEQEKDVNELRKKVFLSEPTRTTTDKVKVETTQPSHAKEKMQKIIDNNKQSTDSPSKPKFR